jgi:uncharacterized protein with HEPN domain
VKSEQEYLEHILECIEIIQEYTDKGREALQDLKTQDAVIRRLHVMAESCLRLPDEIRNAYPEVGWQHIRNFRNRLVHEYLEVDIDLIWTIIGHNLPALKAAVEAALSDLNDQ